MQSVIAEITSIVVPVFVLIGIGYVTAKTNLLSQNVGEALGQYVYVIAIPVLIFKTLAIIDLGNNNPWLLWGAYFSGVTVIWTLATLIIRLGFGREARAGVVAGISAAFANTVMIGIPLVSSVYGEAGLIPLLIIISVHLPVMTVVTAILMERAAALDGVGTRPGTKDLLASIGKGLATNPIVIALVAALVWRTLALPIEGITKDVLDRISSTALPVALLSLGMSMVLYGIRGNVLPGLILSFLKIVLMPAVVYLCAVYLFRLPPLWTAVATLTAACPTGINAYIFAQRYGTGHAMSTNSITITTLLAVVSSSIWVILLGYWLEV